MKAVRLTARIVATWRWLTARYVALWRRSWAAKILIIVMAFLVLITGSCYGIAQWYIASQVAKPVRLGATFIPDYARSLGLDPQQTMDAMLDDLGIRQLRLVSYWSRIEAKPDSYDFRDLDWQFDKAEAAGAKVSLALGLRQPRWPECHEPDWARSLSSDARTDKLADFIQAVVERYRSSPALASYQLENEFFNRFGECRDFDRQRLIDEFALVKRLDGQHPVILTRSNNYGGFALGKPQADITGISVYRRTWDAEFTKQYFQYPFPSWHYAFLAGAQKLLTGQDSLLHELQAEPWPPRGQNIVNTSLAEQNKSFDAQRLRDNVTFAKATGLKQIDLWGAEYWYYRMTVLGDASVWQAARGVYRTID